MKSEIYKNCKHNLKNMNILNMRVYFNNKDIITYLYKEIFEENEYIFNTNKPKPFIIDCGSNIGISVLYFKHLSPSAKILSFEPDPITFPILQKNVVVNNLDDVNLINAAVSRFEGTINFYGQIYGENPDSLGNSILKDWGLKTYTDETQVSSVKLSSYVNSEVDYLKLDVEGAEQGVLEDLDFNNKLKFVKRFSIEVHETDKIAKINSLEGIKNILKKYNFKIKIIKHDISCLIPKKLKGWVIENSPSIYIIHGSQ